MSVRAKGWISGTPLSNKWPGFTRTIETIVPRQLKRYTEVRNSMTIVDSSVASVSYQKPFPFSYYTAKFEGNNNQDIFAEGRGASFYKTRSKGNTVSYVDFIASFAPCVSGRAYWDNTTHMESVVAGTTELESFFSTTDEAFILLAIHNYRHHWLEEFELDAKEAQEGSKRKVRIVMSPIES